VKAILLIAHGSREPEANADVVHVADEIRRSGPYKVVEAAFLEQAPPNIDDGAARCVRAGATSIVMAPYFLSAGIHVTRDLREAHQRLQALYPDVEIRLAEPFGRHEQLTEIVLQRAREAEGNSSIH
jgi:sirohydrochlorin ferrochelatase